MVFIVLGIIVFGFFIVLMYSLLYVSGQQSRIEELREIGPFSIATIENVGKKKSDGDVIRYYNECKIKYFNLYNDEIETTINLPYEDIPVGGQLKIAYSPENFSKVYLIEALFIKEKK